MHNIKIFIYTTWFFVHKWMEEALNIHNYSFLEGEETKGNGVIISRIVLCLAKKKD